MHIEGELRRRGGVVLARHLIDAGVKATQIKRAVSEGRAVRPSRGWVALPDADPQLVAAAQTGVVLSCATAAARHGLREVSTTSPHVALEPGAKLRRPTAARVHWCVPLIRRPPGTLVDPVENALAIAAECIPHEEALAIWESALRLERVSLDDMRTLPLGPQGRRLAEEALPFADAGMESTIFTRLRWLGLPMRRQAWVLGHRVDVLVGDRLVIQVDGGHQVDDERASGNRHDAKLILAGYHVIRVSPKQLARDWHAVQDLILGAIARGFHLAA